MKKQLVRLASTAAVATMLLASAQVAVAADAKDNLAYNVLDTLTVETQSDDYDSKTDRPDDWAQANDDPGDYSTTRDVILARDMTDVTYNSKHQVATGTLHDPYTGTTIDFKRTNYAGEGTGNSNAVQIDHVVAFGEAWESGLDKADESTVEEYYNDPYVLLAVDGPSNGGKSDSDAAEWLPSMVDADGKDTYDCYYVARQIGIKDKYGLSVDTAEKTAMENVLASCPLQTVPSEQDGAYWTAIGDVNGDGQYTLDDLKNVTLVVNDEPVEGFDWDTHEYTVPDADKYLIAFDGLPDGWLMSMTAKPTITPDPDPEYQYVVIRLTAPDGTDIGSYKCQWWKRTDTLTGDVNGDGKYTAADLKNVTVTVDGEPLAGFDPTVGQYEIDHSYRSVEFDNIPDGWTQKSTGGNDLYGNLFNSIKLTSPDGLAVATYTFTYKTGADDTTDNTFTVSVDGMPLDGFDPSVTEYTVSDPSSVSFSNLPDGWSVEHEVGEDGAVSYTLKDESGVVCGIYRFIAADSDGSESGDDSDLDFDVSAEGEGEDGRSDGDESATAAANKNQSDRVVVGSDENIVDNRSRDDLAQTGVRSPLFIGMVLVVIILLAVAAGVACYAVSRRNGHRNDEIKPDKTDDMNDPLSSDDEGTGAVHPESSDGDPGSGDRDAFQCRRKRISE